MQTRKFMVANACLTGVWFEQKGTVGRTASALSKAIKKEGPKGKAPLLDVLLKSGVFWVVLVLCWCSILSSISVISSPAV